MKTYKYKGIKLVSNKELSYHFNVSTQSVRQWRQDKKELIRLGLTFKELLDNADKYLINTIKRNTNEN